MEGRMIRTYMQWWLFFACVWWILLIPLSYNLFDTLLLPLRSLAGEAAFSDSRGMYLLLVWSVTLGVLSALVTLFLKVKTDARYLLHVLLTWFLALILFKYGWLKIMKLQFYLPEPNTLYTRFGFLSKDIAYWSLMGSSRIYTLATGIVEVVAALLLIFPRTRLIGLLTAVTVFANVFLINLSFDISVKLFSGTLVCFSILGAAYYRKRLAVLIGHTLKDVPPLQRSNFKYGRILKALAVTAIVLESLYPSIATGNTNDDKQPRPWHHGAYAVTGSVRWKKLYVHRHGYLILEDKSDRHYDFKTHAQSRNKVLLTDQRSQRTIQLEWNGNTVILLTKTPDTLQLSKLPYRSLPLLKEAIHPFADTFH